MSDAEDTVRRSVLGNVLSNAATGERSLGAADLLHAALSTSVIPSLVERARRDAPVPDDAMRDTLLRLALRGDNQGASALLSDAVTSGIRPISIGEELITSVARALGAMWEDDSCDFVTVTCATRVLEELVREMRQLTPPRLPANIADRPVILLAGAPGEQHVLALSLLSDAFERQGWEAPRAVGNSAHALLAEVSARHFDVLGISVATDRFVSMLPELIAATRRLSKNSGIRILVGGAALLRQPETGTRIGADAIALDAETALREASRLFAETRKAK